MAIDEKELARRRHFIGASDVAAILGISPWKTRVDLWMEKTLGATNRGNKNTRRGNRWEARVLEDASEYLEAEIIPGPRHEKFRWWGGVQVPFAANLDGWIEASKSVVEAKTTNSMEGWGTPGTDEIPDHYLCQVYLQMWCAGAEIAYVPVLCGFEFFLYVVKAPAREVLVEILDQCCEFWVKHVVGGVRPEGPPPSLGIVTSVRREPDSAVMLDDNAGRMVAEWRQACDEKRAATKKEERLRCALIELLGDAEVGVCAAGHLTYFANARGARSLKWQREARGRS